MKFKLLLAIFVSTLSLQLMASSSIKLKNFQIFIPAELSEKLSEKDQDLFVKNYARLLKKLFHNYQKHVPKEIQKELESYQFVMTMIDGLAPYGMFMPEVTESWDRKNKNLFIYLPENYQENYRHIFFNPFENMDELYRLLAHELFHAIHHIYNPDEEDWVKEGLAQLFEWKMNGKPYRRHLEPGIKDLTTPLITEYDHNNYQPALYGHHMMYFHYLRENCGGMDTMWEVMKSNYPAETYAMTNPNGMSFDYFEKLVGSKNISAQLAESQFGHKPQCLNFLESAINFNLARLLNRVVWNVDDERRYFLYAYHPSPIINIYQPKIAEKIPKLTPFVLTKLEHIQQFPADLEQSFDFFEVKFSQPFHIKKLAKPSKLEKNYRPIRGSSLIIIRKD